MKWLQTLDHKGCAAFRHYAMQPALNSDCETTNFAKVRFQLYPTQYILKLSHIPASTLNESFKSFLILPFCGQWTEQEQLGQWVSVRGDHPR